jgi:probable F420-dependent oxidoreductase
MRSKRWSLSVPIEAFSLPELAEVAREAERLGYTDAWSSEVDGVDGFTPLAGIALATGMRVGIAIANVYTRGPATLASTAAGLAELAPGRFVLGIGAGSQVIVESWNGGRFVKPATRVREMAQVLKAAFAGERVVFAGETIAVDGFRLNRPTPAPIPVHIAALRPGMLKVAGEVGDGAITNWLSPEDVPKVVAVVREAARAAGRDPEALEISARLFLNLDPPGPEAETAVRRHLAAYLNVPVYKAFQQWLGRAPALAPMWEAWERGDRRRAVAAIPSTVIDDLISRGPHAALKARVERYLQNGLDTAFLAISCAEPDRTERRHRILDAIRALAPGRA